MRLKIKFCDVVVPNIPVDTIWLFIPTMVLTVNDLCSFVCSTLGISDSLLIFLDGALILPFERLKNMLRDGDHIVVSRNSVEERVSLQAILEPQLCVPLKKTSSSSMIIPQLSKNPQNTHSTQTQSSISILPRSTSTSSSSSSSSSPLHSSSTPESLPSSQPVPIVICGSFIDKWMKFGVELLPPTHENNHKFILTSPITKPITGFTQRSVESNLEFIINRHFVAIRNQIMHYMSFANVRVDRFLQSQMDDNGWVLAKALCKFSRIRQITECLQFALDVISEISQETNDNNLEFADGKVRSPSSKSWWAETHAVCNEPKTSSSEKKSNKSGGPRPVTGIASVIQQLSSTTPQLSKTQLSSELLNRNLGLVSDQKYNNSLKTLAESAANEVEHSNEVNCSQKKDFSETENPQLFC